MLINFIFFIIQNLKKKKKIKRKNFFFLVDKLKKYLFSFTNEKKQRTHFNRLFVR
jgi:hypothetical protein